MANTTRLVSCATVVCIAARAPHVEGFASTLGATPYASLCNGSTLATFEILDTAHASPIVAVYARMD